MARAPQPTHNQQDTGCVIFLPSAAAAPRHDSMPTSLALTAPSELLDTSPGGSWPRDLSVAEPWVIAFPSRFERAAAVLRRLGVFPPARLLEPLPAPQICINDRPNDGHGSDASHGDATGSGSSTLNRGVLSLTATHAAAWARAISSNATIAVFEDDIDIGDPKEARGRLKAFTRTATPCELVLFGHCGVWSRRCTHAYLVTPVGAHSLLRWYEGVRGCAQPDDPQEALCSSRARACCSARGKPGVGLYGGGVIGQNRSLPHYLHFRPCHRVKATEWAARGCKSLLDYETPGEGTQLFDDGGASAAMPSAREDFVRRYGAKIAAVLLRPTPARREREGQATAAAAHPAHRTLERPAQSASRAGRTSSRERGGGMRPHSAPQPQESHVSGVPARRRTGG